MVSRAAWLLGVAWRSQIARGERLGPTIVTAGALIDGDPPEWPGSVVLTRAADVDALVVAQKAAGYCASGSRRLGLNLRNGRQALSGMKVFSIVRLRCSTTSGQNSSNS